MEKEIWQYPIIERCCHCLYNDEDVTTSRYSSGSCLYDDYNDEDVEETK